MIGPCLYCIGLDFTSLLVKLDKKPPTPTPTLLPPPKPLVDLQFRMNHMINRRLLRLFFRYFHTQKRKLCRQMTCAWTCQLWAVQSNCFSVTGWAETRSGSIIARYNTLVPLPPSAPGPPCRPVLPSTSLPTPHPCVLSLSDVTRALVTVAVVLCCAA